MPNPQTIAADSSSASVHAALLDVLSRLREISVDSAEGAPLRGGSGDDSIVGSAGDDDIRGRAGDDTIDAGDGGDRVDAGSGDDVVLGGGGDDLLLGGSGDDEIDGGDGDDVIRAGSGDDVVSGGEGDDSLRLGSGQDRVEFSGEFGDDVIEDFRVGVDVIDITAFGDITSVDELTFTEIGGDTVITAAGLPGSITVKGAGAAELKAASSIEVACYLAGTMILTPGGEIPVERLAIGDQVTTADGVARAVKWIGRRSFSARFLKPGSRILPITIKAGALGENDPVRDLHVSPGHSMLVDGKLVNADLLINGETVLRTTRGGIGDTIAYVHVELESPDAIIAEGSASETYVNDDNRRQFDNWATYVARYGEDQPARRLANGLCSHRFPHVEGGAELEALRARIAARAAALRAKAAA